MAVEGGDEYDPSAVMCNEFHPCGVRRLGLLGSAAIPSFLQRAQEGWGSRRVEDKVENRCIRRWEVLCPPEKTC